MLQGVQAGLQSLIEGGILPRTLIIDDGWQMTAVDEDYAGVLPTTHIPLQFASVCSGVCIFLFLMTHVDWANCCRAQFLLSMGSLSRVLVAEQ